MSDSLQPHGLQHPGFPVRHQLPEWAQTDEFDAIQPSHPLSPVLLLSSIFPSIRVFSNVLALDIRWPKYCSFSFSNSSFNEYSGSISFQIDWFDFLAVHASLTPLALGCFVTQQWKPKKASQTPRVGGDGGPAFSSTVIVRLCTGQENSPFLYLE